jgi:gephyrin
MDQEKLKVAILVVSDTASSDPATDKCIPVLHQTFEDAGQQWQIQDTKIVPDAISSIQKYIIQWTDALDPANLIITSGGTGFAVKDKTPEVSLLVL